MYFIYCSHLRSSLFKIRSFVFAEHVSDMKDGTITSQDEQLCRDSF